MQTAVGKGLGKEQSRKYHLWEFDSLREVVDYARNHEHHQSSDRPLASHYNLTNSLSDAADLAIDGWHDIRNKVDGYLEPMREKLGKILSTETVRVHDMIGVEPDIDRYIMGEIECMMDDVMVEAPKDGKVFTMMVDVSMTWDNSADDIAKRGATLCALVESFIMLGYQLELWSEFTVRGSETQDMATCLVRVNKAGEPIDIDCMMFALGHPDYGRRILWGWGEANTITRDKMGFNGGYYGLHRNGSHFIDRIGASTSVSLDGNRSMTADPIKWITDQLEMQGIFNTDSF